MKSDVKAALKAKDKIRLDVLRAILAEITNASKTSSPFKTDIQLLSLLRKRATTAKSAADEFASANRADLRDKEIAQATVLEEYASGMETLSQEELTEIITETISRRKKENGTVNVSSIFKSLFGAEGVLDGKPVERAQVARIVNALL